MSELIVNDFLRDWPRPGEKKCEILWVQNIDTKPYKCFRNEVVPHTVSSVNNKRSKRWSQHLYSFRVATMVHIKTYARVMKRWRRYWSTSTAVTFLPLCLHRAWWEYVHSVPIYILYIYQKYARSCCTRSGNVIQLGTIASKWIFLCCFATNDEIHSILIVSLNDILWKRFEDTFEYRFLLCS